MLAGWTLSGSSDRIVIQMLLRFRTTVATSSQIWCNARLVEIAVISDLHLGPGGRADSFGHDDFEFARFLGFLERNFERIVLLGDIWECLTGTGFCGPAHELRAAQLAHRELAHRLAGPRYSYVHGNHDLVAGLYGAPDELVLEADGLRLLFTHGHHHDLILRRAPWLSEAVVWLGGWVRRMRLSPIYRLGVWLEMLRAGARPDQSHCCFQRWAVRLAEHRSADIIVTGHTHLATRAEHGSRLFLNSGSCSEGQYSFLSLDTRLGRYSVHSSW